jgi:hypothetical protein
MKRISVVTVIVLFGVVASSEAKAQGAQGPDPIPAIRQQYAAINRKIAKYQKVKKELLGFSAEGGELVAYLSGPSIVKISATFYGEMGRATDEFYYSNDKLIFVFRRHSHYRAPLTGKVVRITENRYYFKDDKLIRWIGEDGKGRPLVQSSPLKRPSSSRVRSSSRKARVPVTPPSKMFRK